MKITFGKNTYDGGVTIDLEWSDFIDCLRDYASIPKPPADKLDHTPWIAAMVLHEDASDHKEPSIDHMSSFACLDLDEAGWTVERIGECLKPFEHVIYTTANSTVEAPRWRVIVRLDREHTKAEYRSVWCFLADHIFEGAIDPSTKNCGRISYAPFDWEGRYNQFHHIEGESLPVSDVVACCPIEEDQTTTSEPVLAYGMDAPEGEAIIPEEMANHFINQPSGRRFFRMMVAAAARFKVNGWTLQAAELERAALQVLPRDKSGKRKNTRAEAENAISWVNTNVEGLNIRCEAANQRLADKMKRWRGDA